jgi:hypothetical protein
MVTEISYRYEPIFPITGARERTISEFAAFSTRENRDLSAPRNTEGVTVAECD